MKTRLLISSLIVLRLLPTTLPAQAAQAMPVDSTAPAGLLQFTSGGHALGFAANGVYAAAGDHVLHVEFAGAHDVGPQADPPADGQRPAATLTRVEYAGLWDGITLTYTADAGGVYTTTYTLAPGADPSAIRLSYNVTPVVNSDGSLGIAFSNGALTETAPIAWQKIDGRRVPVEASFEVRGQEVTFALGAYDPAYALTIDPTLYWNTFLGGSSNDAVNGVTVDGNMTIYVTGESCSAWGSPVHAYAGACDAFAARLNPSGGLMWLTFLGQAGSDSGYGIAVDTLGYVFVAGRSDATWGSPVQAHGGGTDGFVARLDSSNGALTWNTFLGGTAGDSGAGVAADADGNVYVTGDSAATWGTPVRAYTGGTDAFVAKLASSTGALSWNAFLGGSAADHGKSIAADGSGNAYVTGSSAAAWGNPVRAYTGDADAFIAEFNSSGSIVWSTFLGGSAYDSGDGVAVSGSAVYMAGQSAASWGSPVRAYTGGTDALAARLDASNGALTWTTFLGGSGNDGGFAVTADSRGVEYLAGRSDSAWGSPLVAFAGGPDAFAVKLDSAGGLVSHTFLGSGSGDTGNGIAFDGSVIYVGGTSSAAWGSPVRAFTAGGSDAFVAEILLPHICPLGGLPLFDFNGDCRTDVAVYRPSTGTWYVRGSSSASYGSTGDAPVPGDYNGDGTTDVAVYRPATGAWYVRNLFTAFLGQSGDIPVTRMYYNLDGTTDIAVFRPSTGAWYFKTTHGGSWTYYGSPEDIPVPGDYDGDGAASVAVYRPSTGAWYVSGQSTVYYGVSTDIPVPGDYNGDGTTDIAVYRPATGAWYVRGQSTVYYGTSTDIPIPGDYDGDGATEIAVFRPSTGAWYVRGQPTVFYGESGDIPLPEMGTGKASTAP